MKKRSQAREVIVKLALEDFSAVQIEGLLKEQELDGLFSLSELEMIVMEVQAAHRLIPHRPGTVLPRVVGLIAVIFGGAGIWIGIEGTSLKRYNPAGGGVVAIVLGVVLLFKPSSGNTKI